MIQVHLSSPGGSVAGGEEGTDGLVCAAGCNLAFLLPGTVPVVLSVDADSPAGSQGVRADDRLVSIDGRDTRTLAKEEARVLLRTARQLDFDRPERAAGADAGLSPPSLSGKHALDLAMPKAAHVLFDASEPPSVAATSGGTEAPPPLANALGFFEHGSGDVLAAMVAGGYQKAQVASSSWAGKGPFDKGGKGEKGKPGKPASGKTMLAPMFVPPPPVGAPPLAAGGKGQIGMAVSLPGGRGAGPRVVLPPALTGQVAFPADPGEQPECLPPDNDPESWLELLRDGYAQQFRGENEWPEPPAFHRALHFAAPAGEKVPAGRYPREALNMQLQLLFKVRTGAGPDADSPGIAANALVPPPVVAWPLSGARGPKGGSSLPPLQAPFNPAIVARAR